MSSALKASRSILGATMVIFGIALWRYFLVSREQVPPVSSTSAFLGAIPFVLIIFLFIFSWTKYGERLINGISKNEDRPAGLLSIVALFVFIVSLPLFTFIVFYPYYTAHARWNATPLGPFLQTFSVANGFISVRVLLFWMILIVDVICAKLIWRKLSWRSAFLFSMLVNASIYCVAVVFREVNNYPFALGWSDVSRIYGASLFFAPRLYGHAFPLAPLHPTWHLMLTVPYFLGNLPVWVHRFWQAFLEFGITLATGIVLSRRLGLQKGLVFWGFVIWAFLFIRQIAILFSVLICVIIILGWMKPKKYWLSTLLVILASIWAGLSRINWFPVPGLLAAAIYLLEVPYGTSISWRRYLWKPFSWVVVGTVIAFGTNSLYNLLSGNNIKGGQFTSSLSSDLLWDRLLPSTVFPLGILLAACVAAVPLVLVLYLALRQNRGKFHSVRLAGIMLSLFVLFVGGLVVSVKIGGGGDLHNVDAFFVMLLLVGSYFYFGKWTPETLESRPPLKNTFALFMAILVPVWFILQTGGALFTWNQNKTAVALNTVKVESEKTAQNGGQVLFIYQRQLLALKTVNVPLVPDYEQDYLMEMVMSHNQAYLDRFHADLESQKFGLIVAYKYDNKIQENVAWSEENNLWVQEVVLPLNCYYEVAMDYDVALFKPRETPCK